MKKALLVVSFGTSYHDTREKNIAACERDLAASCPDRTLFRAFTSGTVSYTHLDVYKRQAQQS